MNKSFAEPTYRERFLLIVILLSMIPVYFAAKGAFTAFGQATKKSDKRLKKISFENEPIEIVSLKSDGQEIDSGEVFRRDNDWLKDLSFSFKNVSDKSISYLSIALLFPETESNEAPLVHFLKFGVNPLGPKKASERLASLEPGDIAEFGLSAEGFSQLKELLGTRKHLSELTEANYRIMVVFFEDGTQWSAGTYARPDPERPG